MEVPKLFRTELRRPARYQMCRACEKWYEHVMMFIHEDMLWVLCIDDYADYWENTDELLLDYKGY
jgi:hypothetical protein